jgi:hypothetical protein
MRTTVLRLRVLLFWLLTEPHAWPSAILVDEQNAFPSKDALYHSECGRISSVASNLNVRDGISVKPRCIGEVAYRPIEGRPSHSNLCTCHRLPIVPLSHVQYAQAG